MQASAEPLSAARTRELHKKRNYETPTRMTFVPAVQETLGLRTVRSILLPQWEGTAKGYQEVRYRTVGREALWLRDAGAENFPALSCRGRRWQSEIREVLNRGSAKS